MNKLVRLKLVFLCLAAFVVMPNVTLAYDFSVTNSDGHEIYYNLISEKDKTVEVTFASREYGSYSGCVIIPAFVTFDGVTYTVRAIGRKAMRECPKLERVVIPETVHSIGYKAFNGVDNLIEIVLPSSLKRIDGLSVFAGFKRPCKFFIKNPDPASIEITGDDGGLFYSKYVPLLTILVPKGSVDLYKSSKLWGGFKIEPFDY